MAVPSDLRQRGVKLWDALAGSHSLDGAQEVVLHEACRLADRLDLLSAEVLEDGPASGAARHARDSAQAMARLIAALRLPDAAGRKPQARQMRGALKPYENVSSLDRARSKAGA